MILIHSIEKVPFSWHTGKSPDSSCLAICILPMVGFKVIAETTQHTDASLQYTIHNLSLTSESSQNLQLDPQSTPCVHIEPRLSYKFCLPAHYSIL